MLGGIRVEVGQREEVRGERCPVKEWREGVKFRGHSNTIITDTLEGIIG